MDATAIIADWKRRLTAMAENPPYVFRNTPQYLIEKHRQRLTAFAGYPEQEVAEAEARLGVRFPDVFRTYLREMARSPGDLFRGSDLAGMKFEEFRTEASEILAKTDPTLALPPEAVIFLLHQGYTFLFLNASRGFDGPLLQWKEYRREPWQASATVAELVDAELTLMEGNDRHDRERGGYYRTLDPEGGGSWSCEPVAPGERWGEASQVYSSLPIE